MAPPAFFWQPSLIAGSLDADKADLLYIHTYNIPDKIWKKTGHESQLIVN